MRILCFLSIVISAHTSNTPFFYIIDYAEGICSILLRISFAYRHLSPDRSLILSKLASHNHYPDLDEFSLCDYLQFIPRITCNREQSLEDLKRISTSLGCKHSSFKDLHDYGFQLNISDLSCLQGALPLEDFIHFQWNYHQNVWDSFEDLSRVLHFNSPSVAFHWRRGDQLDTRCRNGIDISVNCLPVEYFLAKVNATLAALESEGTSIASVKVFISTNEKDPGILQSFEDLGYYHSAQIKDLLQKRNKTSDSLELFLLDTMIMCSATWVNYFGKSNVDLFVERCKHMRLFNL